MAIELDVARGLANTFYDAFKTLANVKRRMPKPHPSTDQGALPLLYALETEPLRISALAEQVHSDISTVSRQVSNLHTGGLVIKVSDTQDRRVQLVALTEEGHALIIRIRECRAQWMQEALSGWSRDEALTFQRLLEKFSTTLDHFDGNHYFQHTA